LSYYSLKNNGWCLTIEQLVYGLQQRGPDWLQLFNLRKMWMLEVPFNLPSKLWHTIKRGLGTFFIGDFSREGNTDLKHAFVRGWQPHVKSQAINPYHLCLRNLPNTFKVNTSNAFWFWMTLFKLQINIDRVVLVTNHEIQINIDIAEASNVFHVVGVDLSY